MTMNRTRSSEPARLLMSFPSAMVFIINGALVTFRRGEVVFSPNHPQQPNVGRIYMKGAA